MAKTNKKKAGGKKSSAGRLARTWFLPRMRVVLAMAVVAGLGWGLQTVWQRLAPTVIHRDRYLLTSERITVSSLPDWITGDVCAEVVRNGGLERRLSVLDDTFMQVVKEAFVLHPWVESVDRITKSFPPGVHVDLTYRRPIAVVEMASQRGVEFLPIDRHGVHLPAKDVPDYRRRDLPRIGGIATRPPAGQQWADERVAGAAELALQLAEHWKEFYLVDILPSARPEIRGAQRFFVFDLISRGGTRIVWGAAPGVVLPGEDSLQEKVASLRRCVANHGPLDSEQGPAEVNVRHRLAITPRTVKKPSSLKQAAKAQEEAVLVK